MNKIIRTYLSSMKCLPADEYMNQARALICTFVPEEQRNPEIIDMILSGYLE